MNAYLISFQTVFEAVLKACMVILYVYAIIYGNIIK